MLREKRQDVAEAYSRNPSSLWIIAIFLSSVSVEAVPLQFVEIEVRDGRRATVGRLSKYLSSGRVCDLR